MMRLQEVFLLAGWVSLSKSCCSLKMTDSDHVTSKLPSCSNILKVDDFSLGDWISDCSDFGPLPACHTEHRAYDQEIEHNTLWVHPESGVCPMKL